MKKKFHFMKASGKRTVLLVAVSLLLVVVLAVSATISWIEDVSQVKFNSTDDAQKTPLHVGSKVLKSDMLMEQVQDQNTAAINLSDYFYKSGDMHLSPCYADGDNFYFPIEGSDANGGTLAFRNGTKDDANVNYLSVTFRVKSDAANTAYWFEKTDSSTPYVSFKNGNDNAAGLEQFIRFSITIDGATNVYALDDNGSSPYLKSYKTVENGSASTKTGRSVEEYSYYQEVFKNDNTSNSDVNDTKPNQGPSGGNLNGNTLFTVNKFENNTGVKTVTLKLWLEFGGYTGDYAVTGVDLASVNMKIVSSWAKTRRIYLKDETVDEIDNGNATGEHWLTMQNSPTLHWALFDNTSKHWPLNGCVKDNNNTDNQQYQYFDIPAVYNNVKAALYRCESGGWNTGDSHSPDIDYWDKYTTTFPNTFHSETYTVCTKSFGTWESALRCVQYVNSGHYSYTDNNTQITQFSQPYAYMWDDSTDTGAADKVVQNATWPGVPLTQLNASTDLGPEMTTQNGDTYNIKLKTTEAGWYTFKYTKDANDKYHILVTYSTYEPSLTKTATESSPYRLVGSFNNWAETDSQYVLKNLSSDSYAVSIYFQASNTDHTFKIKNGTTYYGGDSITINKTNFNINSGYKIYTFYYNSNYDRIIFNDNYNPSDSAYQTANINLTRAKTDPSYYVGKVFDMATMKWYENINSLPTYSDYSVVGHFYNSSAGDRNTYTRMAVNPYNTKEVYCRVYVRYKNNTSDASYNFKFMKNDRSKYYGYGYDTGNPDPYWIDDSMDSFSDVALWDSNCADIKLHAWYEEWPEYYNKNGGYYSPGVYGLYFNTETKKFKVTRETIKGDSTID